MGLDTSHNCWHGPYGAFMRWRTWLAAQIGLPLNLMQGFYRWEWDEGDIDMRRDWNSIVTQNENRGVMYWETLHAFSELGKPVSWECVSSPLKNLIRHSDCDGRIRWWDCKPMAIELGKLLRRIPDDTKYPVYQEGSKAGQFIWTDWRDGRACYDGMVPATKRFIVGLLEAWRKREDVIFR